MKNKVLHDKKYFDISGVIKIRVAGCKGKYVYTVQR
jgi:hypothetical protein